MPKKLLFTYYTFAIVSSFIMHSSFKADGASGRWSYSDSSGVILLTNDPDQEFSLERLNLESLGRVKMKWSPNMGDMRSITMILRKN